MSDTSSPPPVHRVTLSPSGWHFDAPADQSLLTAAQAAGIKLPSTCRNGTCRACMCMKTDGEVEYCIEWPGLSRPEKAEGWILPCCAMARSALTIDAPDATLC